MIAITIRWRVEGVDFMEDVCNLFTTVCNEWPMVAIKRSNSGRFSQVVNVPGSARTSLSFSCNHQFYSRVLGLRHSAPSQITTGAHITPSRASKPLDNPLNPAPCQLSVKTAVPSKHEQPKAGTCFGTIPGTLPNKHDYPDKSICPEISNNHCPDHKKSFFEGRHQQPSRHRSKFLAG